MASSPLILAALAKSILPSVKFKEAKSIPSEGRGPVNSALLTDTDGLQYVVRESRGPKGDMELATETQAVRAVKGAGTLPFKLPSLIAESSAPNGHTLQVLEFVYGSNVDFSRVRSSDPILHSFGLALAAIHSLRADSIVLSGMPEFSAADTRESRLGELDRAAATGQIPATLLQRWESALEDLDLFRFQPVVVHGNLTEANVLELGDEISGILGWANLHVGDPAEDFVGLAAQGFAEALEAVKFAYFEGRDEVDVNFVQRATLYSELAIASYLVNRISVGDTDEAQWAVSELETIASAVDSGESRALGTVAFASTMPIADQALDDDYVDDLAVETGNQLIVSETLEAAVDVSDLKTRPIELPSKSDDQLF